VCGRGTSRKAAVDRRRDGELTPSIGRRTVISADPEGGDGGGVAAGRLSCRWTISALPMSVGGGEWSCRSAHRQSRPSGRPLHQHVGTFEVAITGGVISQRVTAGTMIVSLQMERAAILVCGGEYFDIIWDGLDGGESSRDRR